MFAISEYFGRSKVAKSNSHCNALFEDAWIGEPGGDTDDVRNREFQTYKLQGPIKKFCMFEGLREESDKRTTFR